MHSQYNETATGLKSKHVLAKKYPFYIHIGTLFMVLALSIQIGMTLVSRYETHEILLRSADAAFEHVASEARLELKALRGPIENAVVLTTHVKTLVQASTHAQRMERVDVLAATLKGNPQLDAIYLGYVTGDFFLVRTLKNEKLRARFAVSSAAVFLVESVEQAQSGVRWVALDASLRVLREWSSADSRFDPRTRPWFKLALTSPDLVRTDPYLFATTNEIGRTVAQQADEGRAVVGADLLTGLLSEALSRNRVTPSSELLLFDEEGRFFANSDTAKPWFQVVGDTVHQARLDTTSGVMALVSADRAGFGSARVVSHAGREWVVKVTPLLTSASQDYLAIASPVEELLSDAVGIERRLMMMNILLMLLAVPLVWWVARGISSQLKVLMAQTAAIRRFDFKSDFPMATRVLEIHRLAGAVTQMKDTIQSFLEVSLALAAERNFESLITRVLREVREVAASDGGVIYLHDEDAGVFKFVAQQWMASEVTPGGSCPDLSPEDGGVFPMLTNAELASGPTTHLIAYPRPKGLEYLNDRYGQQLVNLLAVPLLGRTGSRVGMILNFIAPGQAVPGPERLGLVQAFGNAAAVAIDQQQLLLAQKKLLNAIIGLVAGAIDAKSPYTGGHCQRVPVLTEMLVRAAHDATEGPFAAYTLNDERWEAVRIAAWLHDCGKVTTPEFVVDKATKLETIYDRIHEVRMRVEVLKRDAEIAALKAVMAGGNASTIQANLQDECKALDSDFYFLASCNEGGEFMSAQRIERLNIVAQRTWLRTLDDRVGISWEERQRKEQLPALPLPVPEKLLDDKPAHILLREAKDLMPEDNPWGFRLKVPQHLYNRGELYNLCIGRGTLSEEERYKINDHVVQSIIMLSQLPFSGHLKSVVEIAGGHHEKMDGSGYPRRLYQSEMSLEARVMAIADIFEALTATDRPYKRGKPLSEAIKIMGFMVKDQHIDADLFRLFLQSGVYKAYAQKYLPPSLIDEVDLSLHLQG